jgi:tripartite-type tricarboxylate transporter receptor subunit TctC
MKRSALIACLLSVPGLAWTAEPSRSPSTVSSHDAQGERRKAEASGQAYPLKPIRIVTTAVGSANDLVVRLITPKMSSALGQPVIVDNRGFIASEIVAKSAPDGYTLIAYGSPLWLAPFLQKVGYDPIRDFAPVALTADTPNVLVVHPSSPAKSVPELVALAKSKPGALNYGGSSPGATPQLAAELFKSMTGTNIVRIPYKGTGPALTGVVSGEVQLMFPNVGAASGHIKSGKLRALAVTTEQPTPLAPGLPTLASSVPGYQSTSPLAILAPASTPRAIVARLNEVIVAALETPDIKERLFNQGLEAGSGSPEKLAALIKSEMAKWARLIKDSSIKGE